MIAADPRDGLRKNSGRMTIDGVLFESWRTGVMRSKWVSEDGRIELFHYISPRGGETVTCFAGGSPITSPKTGKHKKFRTYQAAARAAFAALKDSHK